MFRLGTFAALDLCRCKLPSLSEYDKGFNPFIRQRIRQESQMSHIFRGDLSCTLAFSEGDVNATIMSLAYEHEIDLARIYTCASRCDVQASGQGPCVVVQRRIQLLQCEGDRYGALLVVVPPEKARAAVPPITITK